MKMQIIMPYKVSKYLEKQSKGDIRGIDKVKQFLELYLATAQNPTLLPNCKKCKALKIFGVGVWEIIA